jgi:UDP-glucose:tetrahydrobiopterin glucosyltransferase
VDPGAEKPGEKRHPLSLALVAPLISPITPPFLGGAQVVVHDLAWGLARRGHEVTLFAARGSHVNGCDGTDARKRLRIVEVAVEAGELKPAKFGGLGPAPDTIPDSSSFRQWELFLQTFLQINSREEAFDIAHLHAFDWPAFALAPLSHVPSVHTVHLPSIDPRINAILRNTYLQTGSSRAVTVSHACADTYGSSFRFDRIVHNGVDVQRIPFGPRGHGYLLFAGRMAPEKGPELAISIARRAGRRLIMAGGIYDAEFFAERVAPELPKGDLEYRGNLRRAEFWTLMSRADAVLFPIRWEEPFGLVLVEALAAGVPVIGWARGAVPEIVENGRQGFLVPYLDIEAAADAVHRLEEIDRAGCRDRAAKHFGLDRMLDQYEQYYLEVMEREREQVSTSGRYWGGSKGRGA